MEITKMKKQIVIFFIALLLFGCLSGCATIKTKANDTADVFKLFFGFETSRMKEINKEIDAIIEKRKSPGYRKQFIINENDRSKNVY
jgi:PBP1b-binding outer membrane lipoprotein LpoB